MSTKKNTYPDWAEKFRGKGRTIRKTKYGYGLYECTSVYVKGGPPKSRQNYLGMITEKDGFIPKKTGDSSPVFIEYGFSRFLYLNFKREVSRHLFQPTAELISLGIIQYIFGGVEPVFIRSSYLTYSKEADFSNLAGKVERKKICRVAELFDDAFRNKVPDENERQIIKNLLYLCVVEAGPASARKPGIPDEVLVILKSHNLKYDYAE